MLLQIHCVAYADRRWLERFPGQRKHYESRPPWKAPQQPASVVAFVAGAAQGDPQEFGGFFLDFNDGLGLFQSTLEPTVLSLKFRHTRGQWILGTGLAASLLRAQGLQSPFLTLVTPCDQVRMVQAFTP